MKESKVGNIEISIKVPSSRRRQDWGFIKRNLVPRFQVIDVLRFQKFTSQFIPRNFSLLENKVARLGFLVLSVNGLECIKNGVF